MRKLGRAGLVAGLAALLFAVGGVGLFKVVHSDSPPPVPDQATGRLAGSPFIPGASLGQAITSLQERLRSFPTDWRSYAGLGLAYVQEARITADPSYYPKAEGVLDRSLAIDRSHNYEGLTGLGALALARHDFSAALSFGRQARTVNPYNANVYGVMGDALVELGRYGAAFATFQHMVELKPNLSSYARISYEMELQGDFRQAVSAMRLAYTAAGTAVDASWASYQLGELYWNAGLTGRAEAQYRRAVRLDPSFVPPQAGLAKVAWARGDIPEAIRRYRAAAARYPLPEYVIALGDLYAISGQKEQAAEQYALVRAEEALFRANGVNVDLELSLFDADHGRAAAALRAARVEWARRHSVHVADALGWALYRNGRAAEALPYAGKALALGTRSALFHYHAGMIELALGDRSGARRDLAAALRINPHFSILGSPAARAALAHLGGTS